MRAFLFQTPDTATHVSSFTNTPTAGGYYTLGT
jgi:hypothetical protein